MSKSLSAGMLSHIAGATTSLAWAATLTRTDGQVFRYTSGTRNITIGANLYLAQPGFAVSDITSTLGLSVDTLQMLVLATDDLTRADFLTGRWDGCRVELAQYNWAAPADGFIPWPTFTVANTEPIQGGFSLELRDLRQPLQQDYTRATGKTCPYRLGDARCAKDLTAFTFAFTVTGVTSRSIFTCSALAQAADYFSSGELVFADGLHGGLRLLVRNHGAGGVITLAVPLIDDVVIGQTGTIVAGCLRRFDEDCKTKFSNVLNFGGHKDTPSVAELVGS